MAQLDMLEQEVCAKDHPDVQRLVEECYKSTEVTAKVLFPQRFSRPFSPSHRRIFNVLDHPDRLQQVVIAAPRCFGKTSIINLAYPAKKTLFLEKKFIVPVSCSSTAAIDQSENLKFELLTNPMINKLFGSVKSDSFTKDKWITSNGVCIYPRGAGQQIRGLIQRDFRPDLYVVDDLEDKEEVRNEEIRKKNKEWFFSDLMGSVDKSKKDWQIFVIGTLTHEDCLLQNLVDDPNWTSIVIELCDDKGHSCWPEYMTDADIGKLIEQHRVQGLLDVFYMEYRNKPVATENCEFRKEMFQYYHEEDIMDRKTIENVILIDPAKTVQKQSKYSAVVGVGVDTISNRIYLRDVVCEMMHPDRLYDEAFKMAIRLRARAIGIEVTGLNEFVTYPLTNEMIRRGLSFEIVPLKPRLKKEDRISMLVPFYRRGLVYHNRAVCQPVEVQLLSFPRGKYVDAIDAFAYIVEMLEVGSRYFQPSELEEMNEGDWEEEYKELDSPDDMKELIVQECV